VIAELLVTAVGVYLALGLIFAMWFVSAGVARLDTAAKGSGVPFRMLIVPGTVALWPVLLFRCVHS
jgi:hypothetical protein